MKRLLFGLVAVLASNGATLPSQAQAQQSFTKLAADGYEIKSVTLVPIESARRIVGDAERDTVIITLQKERTIAVCYYYLSSWIALTKSSLDNAAQCEVR